MSKSDKNLITRYRNGDDEALKEFIGIHNIEVSSFIYSKVPNREVTEEIWQETFIHFIKDYAKRKPYSDKAPLDSLMKIAHNKIIDWFRANKKRVEPGLLLEFSIDENTTEEEIMEVVKGTILMADESFRDLGGSGLKIASITSDSMVETIQLS